MWAERQVRTAVKPGGGRAARSSAGYAADLLQLLEAPADGAAIDGAVADYLQSLEVAATAKRRRVTKRLVS